MYPCLALSLKTAKYIITINAFLYVLFSSPKTHNMQRYLHTLQFKGLVVVQVFLCFHKCLMLTKTNIVKYKNNWNGTSFFIIIQSLVEICAHDFVICECSVSARCSVGTWWYDRTLQRCARSSTTPRGTFVHTSLHSPRADAWSTHSAGLFCRATPPVLRTNSRTDRKRYGLAQFLHVQGAQGHTHILVLLEEN